MVDDILDVCGDEATLGKTVGSDESRNKTTFLTYYDLPGAKEYATALTARAVEALSDWQDHQTLAELAEYLLNRTY